MIKVFGIGLVVLSILSTCSAPDSSSASMNSSTRPYSSSTTTVIVSSNPTPFVSPNTTNVIISSSGSTLYYDYYAYVFGGEDYDAYWPRLKIMNSSSRAATISFRYSFYVCGYKQTDSSLNKTVSHYSPRGTSYWEMSEANSLVIRSTDTCGGSVIDVSDVEFTWTVLSVTAS